MRSDAALISALERANIHPLWDRYQRITPMAPKAKDAPMHWRWRELEPFTERAAHEVAIEDVERRALILANPAFGGATVTTQNLIGAFTVLEPGDKAVPHRHTAAAIRFATRAEGAVTIVNGRRCEMKEGDLVLTPPMCWHGHINQGPRRTVWFDAANMPAVCALDASFFEPGKRQDERFWEVSDAGSQEYRFPGDETRRQI
ncbi:MAG TPA: cupin domain-containing protein, partial [Burkholderiales bacterium]|nr:cupin domain-containing protein [Burkholderiales bacterium]